MATNPEIHTGPVSLTHALQPPSPAGGAIASRASGANARETEDQLPRPDPTKALLLVNLGTPRSPSTPDLRTYLREFLSDPAVLDVPAALRWFLLHAIILPLRPKRSAHAYRQIWTERGSPLLFHTQDLCEKVQARLGDGVAVAVAMRYGEPSIEQVLRRLRSEGIRQIRVFPLFPHYCEAVTGSSMVAVREAVSEIPGELEIEFVPAYFADPGYIEALARVAGPVLGRSDPEKVVLSFHGLPERQVRKADPTGGHCLADPDCCDKSEIYAPDCYRAQCLVTARKLADALSLPREKLLVTFQSQFGPESWLKPQTESVFTELAESGVRRIAVITPGFAADCLETLEEIQVRRSEVFRAGGGEELTLVPCLNSADVWADAVAQIAANPN